MSVTTTHPLLQDSLMRPVPRLCFGLKVKRLGSGGGASVPIGKGALLAAYGTSDVDVAGPTPERTSKIMTVGYDYPLSKRTNVYAVYLSDKFTGLTNDTTFAAGLQHRF